MFIRIESSSGVPITRQIMDQVRAQCATGALAAGERLPSVRELARELAVNQNTILKVYERLSAEGLLEMRHGSGTFVSEEMQQGGIEAQRKLLEEEAERFAHRAASLGLSAEQAASLVEEAFGGLQWRGVRTTPSSSQPPSPTRGEGGDIPLSPLWERGQG
jgi:GntR family transcriptional regulator